MDLLQSNIPLWYFLLAVIVIIFTIFAIFFVVRPKKTLARYKLIKRSLKKNYTALSAYLATFILLAIFVTLIAYTLFVLTDHTKNPSVSDKVEKALTIGVTAAGFLSVIASIKIWQDTDKRQVDNAVLLLFDKLQDSTFADIRYKAWGVKEKWDSNEKDYRIKLEANSFKRNVDKTVLRGLPSKEITALREDMINVRRLFEFYSSLIVYGDKPDSLVGCHYFYYDWWRSFLYEMAQLHDKNYLQDRPIKMNKNIDYKEYESNISYIKKLENIDRIFGFEKILPKESFY